MKKTYQKLISYIQKENRDEAVLYALKLLDNNDIDIVTLYQDVLAFALNTIDCDETPEECIWKEHVQTAIVRTIIEVSYPYIIKEKESVQKKDKKVLVVCPTEEYHEIGAKMAHDFFLLSGYDSHFIGANTPTSEIISAIEFLDIDLVALSVTNTYNTIRARQIVYNIKKAHLNISVAIGGRAFEDSRVRKQVNADHYLTNYQSIQDLGDK